VRKYIKICLLGVLMIGFFSSFFWSSISPKRKMAFKITNHLGKKFEKKYGLRFAGISEAAPKGKYTMIGLELDYNKILSKDEGRVLLLACAEEMLHAFNSCQSFRQYMADYPFKGDNIIINIFVQTPSSPDVYYLAATHKCKI